MRKIISLVFAICVVLTISSCQKSPNQTTKLSSLPVESTTKQFSKLNIKTEAPESSSWRGEWVRVGSRAYLYSQINITKVSSSDFQFEINSNNGGATGNVSGTAKIDGKTAVYFDDETKAKVIFSLQNGTLTVEYPDEFNINFGYGVDCDGDYKQGIKSKEPTLEEIGILDKGQEEAFKNLVGEDYHLFLETLGLSEDGDLDNVVAKVYSGYARALHCETDSIIMVCANNRFNAAVIDGDVVKYFSNIKSFEHKLPKTIDKWREDFKSYKVVYMAK